MSPWLIQTFFLSLPRIWARRFSPSKQRASRRPLPSILMTCAYSIRADGNQPCRTRIERALETRYKWYGRAKRWIGRTLTFLFKGQFSLLIVILVLPSTPVLTSLCRGYVSSVLETPERRKGKVICSLG